jgi:uncharacterized protein YwqG
MAIPVGASKIGGRPDLPPGTPWPARNEVRLAFLGQINLGELGGFPAARLLPESGLLSFFYHPEQQAWGDLPTDEGSWRVLYLEDIKSLVRSELPDDLDSTAVFPTCTCAFHNSLQIPGIPADETKSAAAFSEKTWVELGEWYSQPREYPASGHRILGLPNTIQNDDMEFECQLVTHGIALGSEEVHSPQASALADGARDWVLLFQLDSDKRAGMMWGDAGMLYFWIREEDLNDHRFDRVWMISQCC